MLYNYNEAIELFGSDYFLKQALAKKTFFKIKVDNFNKLCYYIKRGKKTAVCVASSVGQSD